jgi:glyoxylase-like metal-dependent hydrolase (beta-lactamase superfamily II)
VRATEVVPGVHRMWFPGINNNAYLIAGSEATLIDSGPPRHTLQVLAALPATSLRPADVRHIAVTHCHTDHTGQLAGAAEATGATVYATAVDAAIIRSGAERPRGRAHGLVGRIMLALARGTSRADPAPVAVEVRDEQVLPAAGGIRCVLTPGHTPGHVSFLWPGGGGVLFVGDAAANMLHRLAISPINEDDDAARASFRKLAELEFATACFGHGPPIRARAAAAFRRRLGRL